MLWRARRLDLRRVAADHRGSGQGRREVTQLVADGTPIADALGRGGWGARAVQAIVCAECGIEGCAAGGWIAPRDAGAAVIWLPAFDEMIASGAVERAPPAYVRERGLPLFEGQARDALIEATGIRPPPVRMPELARAMQWCAPRAILGTFPDPIALRAQDVLAVSDGEPDAARQELLARLELALREDTVVVLRKLREGDEALTFFLDAPGHLEWSPLVRAGGETALAIDGLVATAS